MSSSGGSDLPRLVLHIRPGVVSASYFVLFDLILLTIVDIVLARTVSWAYFRRIYQGFPVTLRSSDIPGVTSFLIGSFWTPINLAALAIKLAFLSALLNIDIAIDADTIRPQEKFSLNSTLGFNATDAYWEPLRYVGSSYLWDRSRTCRVKSEDDDSITYYHLSFNMSGNASSDSLFRDEQVVDVDSIQCLSPERVTTESARPLLVIKGCSPSRQTGCTEPISDVVSHRNGRAPSASRQSCFSMGPTKCVNIITRRWDNFTGIQYYVSGTLFCTYVIIGDISEHMPIAPRRVNYFQSCLLSTKVSNGHLVENWTYNSSKYTRRYPGPVFEQDPELGFQQVMAAAPYLFTGNVDYETLSSIFVANGGIPKQDNQTVTLFQKYKTVTVVPFYALVLIAIITLATILVYFVITVTIAKDSRPQLNVINGLSSIAREENQPSGRSLTAGRGIAIGLILRYPNAARLVPVQKGFPTVSRASVSEIV